MAKVLNPFAYYLNGKKQHGEYKVVYEQTGKQIYRNDDYTIWKISEYYETCWKNIIITQTTGAPIKLVDALVDGVPPTDEASTYHYNRMREALSHGRYYATEMGFEITNI